MEFRYAIPVRFNDVDRAGIVYYPNFFHYYHVAFEEFFGAAHGTCYPDWIAVRKIGFPTVHVQADFDSPLEYGDIATIAVQVRSWKRSSVEFQFRALASRAAKSGEPAAAPAGSGRVAATGVVTKVCMDLERRRPIPIPEDLTKVFANYRGGAE